MARTRPLTAVDLDNGDRGTCTGSRCPSSFLSASQVSRGRGVTIIHAFIEPARGTGKDFVG